MCVSYSGEFVSRSSVSISSVSFSGECFSKALALPEKTFSIVCNSF